MARTRRAPLRTTIPDRPAPSLRCPRCDSLLRYEETIVHPMRSPERYDLFRCTACQCSYEYRDRTRTLRIT